MRLFLIMIYKRLRIWVKCYKGIAPVDINMKRKRDEEVDDEVHAIMKRIKVMMTRKRKRDEDDEACPSKRIKLCRHEYTSTQYRRDILVYL